MQNARQKHKKWTAPDFRRLLQQELTDRCQANPNYSLRAFARALAVEPSALSQIVNGKRPITQKMKLRLGTALGLSVQQLKAIPAAADDTDPRASIPAYQQLSLDAFAVISDWYHYAILELTYLADFQANSAWVARRLGITKSEANIAIERLFRLELLEKTADGKWIDRSENGLLTHIDPAMTSGAAKKYQCQLLELSKKAVQETPLSERNHTSAAFCFDPEDLAAATARIAEFRRQFAHEFQPKKQAKEVYQIQISFFPLTHSSKIKEK